MADEIQGQYGGLDAKALGEINRVGEEALSTIRDISAEFRGLGSDVESNYAKQANFAKSLAGITAATLKDKKEITKIEKQSKDATQEINRLANRQVVIGEQLAALAGKKTKAAEDERRSLLKQLESTVALKGTFESIVASAKLLVDESKKLASQTKFFDVLNQTVSSIPVLGSALAGPFQQAALAAKSAAEDGAGKMNTYLKGGTALAKGLASMLGPAAVLGALFKVSDQAGQLNRQLGLGMESAGETRARFAEIAQQSGSSRFNTEKLVAANAALNQQLGTSVEFSGDMLKDFTQLTEYMGLSAESAGKLSTLGKITGQTSSEFAGNIAASVMSANKTNGIFVSTSTALEKIKNLSGTTLLNLQRNPKAIGEAIVATEKLGLSFQQLRTTADSLLNFEQSIGNELEAELLTGKQLNLERARAAALRGDDVTLAKELAAQVGTVAQYEKMNVIQRQSLAQAFGMSADQMADMLMKQELMNKLGKEANDLTSEQARKIKEMVENNPGMTPQQALIELQSQESATKKFQDAVAKLKNVFTDIVAFLSPVLDKFGGFISSFASSGLTKVLVGGGIAASLGIALRNMISPRGSSPANPIYTAAGGGGAGGMLTGGGVYGAGLYNKSGYYVDGKMVDVKGKIPAGAKLMKGGLTQGGYGMIGGIGGMAAMMGGNALSEAGHETAGGFLSGAGAGAMAGAAFGPWGMGIGAALGGITALLQNQEKDKQKQEKTQEDKYDEMIKLMRVQAEKQTRIYMNANEVGKELVIGNPRVE